jgi:hypothetical protein
MIEAPHRGELKGSASARVDSFLRHRPSARVESFLRYRQSARVEASTGFAGLARSIASTCRQASQASVVHARRCIDSFRRQRSSTHVDVMTGFAGIGGPILRSRDAVVESRAWRTRRCVGGGPGPRIPRGPGVVVRRSTLARMTSGLRLSGARSFWDSAPRLLCVSSHGLHLGSLSSIQLSMTPPNLCASARAQAHTSRA